MELVVSWLINWLYVSSQYHLQALLTLCIVLNPRFKHQWFRVNHMGSKEELRFILIDEVCFLILTAYTNCNLLQLEPYYQDLRASPQPHSPQPAEPSKSQRALELLGLGMDFDSELTELESHSTSLAEEVDSYFNAPLIKLTGENFEKFDLIEYWQVCALFFSLVLKVLISL